MTRPGELADALQQAQAFNDSVVQHAPSWPQAIDWKSLGAHGPPSRLLTASEIATAVGNSQKVPGASQQPTELGLATGVHFLRLHSVLSEYFPPGHHSHLMNWLTHPQMLTLQRQLLGTTVGQLYFGHSQLLTRRTPVVHGTPIVASGDSPFDDCGVCESLEEYDAQPPPQPDLSRGFQRRWPDGGLKVIPGSHLFRDPTGCRADNDLAIRAGWLVDKRNPASESRSASRRGAASWFHRVLSAALRTRRGSTAECG